MQWKAVRSWVYCNEIGFCFVAKLPPASIVVSY
jgi:hypothetical protein